MENRLKAEVEQHHRGYFQHTNLLGTKCAATLTDGFGVVRKLELMPGATEKIVDKVGLTVLAKNLHITWWKLLILYIYIFIIVDRSHSHFMQCKTGAFAEAWMNASPSAASTAVPLEAVLLTFPQQRRSVCNCLMSQVTRSDGFGLSGQLFSC